MFISSTKVQKSLAKECIGYLASAFDKSKEETLRIEDAPLVLDFVEAFSEDLPRLPHDRVIEF